MKHLVTSLVAASALLAGTTALANDANTYRSEQGSATPQAVDPGTDLQVDRSFGNWGPWDADRDRNAASPRGDDTLDSDINR
ncbi:hypothetical protein GCM10007860_21090 [Chitiniphilus shinanonensis]|uniref:Uncharacterized protein n=1 Tax=Chitiniphilus shinanonensis TaxID=553088 RepID=A0ABQ6BSI6_9NEIS|nr:hypothetical protein [Chitiniphilus shinanonensis]GLS04960.1 hypothetical protein GCM10007860_21090 [Chitiniphilus shinanonensis]